MTIFIEFDRGHVKYSNRSKQALLSRQKEGTVGNMPAFMG